MKILAILFRVPYPLKDGGAIALYNVVKTFSKQQNVDLSVLAFNTTKHYVDPLPPEITSLGNVHTVKIDNRVKPIPALLNLLGNESYHVTRFQSIDFEKKLIQLLQKEIFDLIHFDGLFTSIYLDIARKYAPNSMCVLRQHNVEHQIWERVADGATGLKKKYVTLLASRLKKFETEKIPQFDAIIPITELDASSFTRMGAKKQHVLPVSIDVPDQVPEIHPEPNSVFHLGSLDWIPNQEGIKWFVHEIWPLVLQKNANATFYIAGREMPEWISNYHGKNNIHVLGEVDCAQSFMQSKQVMVVPLKSGSGMRVKIIEGFANRKAIVSTAIGAEGIGYAPGVDIEIADSASDFAQKISALLADETKVREMGEQANQLVASTYSHQATIGRTLQFYSDLITEKK